MSKAATKTRLRRSAAARKGWRTRRRNTRGAVRVQSLKKEDPGSWRLRRWEAADTHRLNKAHWQNAFGRTVNEDLLERLETLRIRSEYEVANDPILEGVVSTFANDVVGPCGPRVQVASDSEAFNSAVEEAIEEYQERPDPTRDESMAEALRVDVRSLCTAGEFLHRFTNMRRQGPFEFAIRSPHPRRLESPMDRVGDPLVFMGIEFKSADEPTPARYWLRDEPPGIYARSVLNWRPVEAQNIQHRFIAHEPDQLRGYPWIAVALNDMADRRDLNRFVMESAKNAAAQGLYWYTDHPEALIEFQVTTETRQIEPGIEQAGPPGYKPFALAPTQPSAQWKEFEHEKLRGYGRPFGMPLMMVLLSSEGNSFSGANHDGQIYIRTVTSVQSWLGCGTLTPQYNQIATEVAIARNVRRPRKVRYTLTWVKPPHPDPKKNYEALRMQLEDGAISLADVCAALDRDFETVQEARAWVNEQLTRFDLPLPPINVGDARQPSRVLRDIADQLEANTGEPLTDGQAESQNDRALQPA